mgnify:CR=1 FL=1
MKPLVALTAALLLGTPAAFAQTSSTTSTAGAQAVGTEEFVRMAGSSNRFEIESSRLALERDVSDGVEEFATQMVADHTKAGEEMKAALEEAGMTVPSGEPEYTDKHAQMLDTLEAAEGDAFERHYVTMQAQAHDEAVMLFSSYARSGDQPALKAFAEETLPTLKEHQQHVKHMSGQK